MFREYLREEFLYKFFITQKVHFQGIVCLQSIKGTMYGCLGRESATHGI